MIFLKLILSLSLVPNLWAEDVKTLRLCEKSVATAYVSFRGSVFDFPTEPEKVVLGTKNTFSIEYIRSDLAISPLTLKSRSNLFVYMQGRRFTLDLVASQGGTTLYFIKDCEIEKIKVKKNGK